MHAQFPASAPNDLLQNNRIPLIHCRKIRIPPNLEDDRIVDDDVFNKRAGSQANGRAETGLIDSRADIFRTRIFLYFYL